MHFSAIEEVETFIEVFDVVFGICFAPSLSLLLRRVYLSHLCFRHFAVGVDEDVVMGHIGPSGLYECIMEGRVVVEAAHFSVDASAAAGEVAHLAH